VKAEQEFSKEGRLMKDSAVRVYRTMIAMCVIACFSLIIHFVIFLTVRREEAFAGPGPESEVMWPAYKT